jgi:hypothetical protein
VKGIAVLGDLRWHEATRSWALRLQLSPGLGPKAAVADRTNWYALVDDAYPCGGVRFLPAKEGGITATFPHQRHNGPGDDTTEWRNGEICLQEPGASVWALAAAEEPDRAEDRLAWYAERALEWIRRASDGTLAQAGDPFELPDFPTADLTRVGFREDRESFVSWRTGAPSAGLAELVQTECNPRFLVAREFRDLSGRWRVTPDWGSALVSGEPVLAGWATLASVPTLPPWGAPTTWRDLRLACANGGTDVLQAINEIAPGLRDGQRHLLLLGFAIPDTIGGTCTRMHWQGLLLPILSHGDVKGFRPIEAGYRRRDHAVVLNGDTDVDWVRSENWSDDHFSPRGLLPAPLRDRSVMLIGAGALSAPFAELLIRGGLRDLLVVDDDTLTVPNLVRHTLGVAQVTENKAEALADRLRHAAVWSAAKSMNRRFPPQTEDERATARACDIVVDCTASDDVLRALRDFAWGAPKLFLSYSLGYGAQRLFCFAATGTSFPYDAFAEQVRPWLAEEQTQRPPADMPMEGPGCWHPAFPARVDSVWQMACVAAKHFAWAAERDHSGGELAVYEEKSSAGLPEGIYRISGSPPGC